MNRKYTDEVLFKIMARAPKEFSVVASEALVPLDTGSIVSVTPDLYVVGEAMRDVAEDVFLLLEAKKESETLLRTLAAIAHSGGVIGLQEREALVHLRKLTLPYFDRRADPYSTYKLIEAAILTQEIKE